MEFTCSAIDAAFTAKLVCRQSTSWLPARNSTEPRFIERNLPQPRSLGVLFGFGLNYSSQNALLIEFWCVQVDRAMLKQSKIERVW